VNILRLLQERAKDYDCGVCGTNHSKSKISVIGKRDDAYVVRVVCSKCETNIILHVYVGERQSLSAKVSRSPLTQSPKRAQKPPISLDEVIDAHELLEAFDGGPTELFAPSGKVRSSSDAQ
jgi:hypothetical protein